MPASIARDSDFGNGAAGPEIVDQRLVLALDRREDRGEAALLDELPERALVLIGCGISNHD
ncbi:RNA methyltransferase, partial [Rhizobium ruizarguesonis]